MIEMHLSGMKARNGTLIFVCSTCKTPPNFTFGARDKGELALPMLCPKCGIVLGEWNSVEARDRELSEFAKTLKSCFLTAGTEAFDFKGAGLDAPPSALYWITPDAGGERGRGYSGRCPNPLGNLALEQA